MSKVYFRASVSDVAQFIVVNVSGRIHVAKLGDTLAASPARDHVLHKATLNQTLTDASPSDTSRSHSLKVSRYGSRAAEPKSRQSPSSFNNENERTRKLSIRDRWRKKASA